jgi:hypothetical protein
MPVRDATEIAIRFSPTENGMARHYPDLETAGESILQLLHKAADVAAEDTRGTLKSAARLAYELRAAKDRITELETEVATYRDRADRAEQWLNKIYKEIDEQLLRKVAEDNRALSCTNAPQL